MFKEGKAGRGISKLALFFIFFAAVFSLGLGRVCDCPAMIKAVETKEGLLEKSNSPCFYLVMIKEVHPESPRALWLAMLSPLKFSY